jgi:hypothetical protein
MARTLVGLVAVWLVPVARAQAEPREIPAQGLAPPVAMTLEEAKGFWSLEPVREPPLPAVEDENWPLGPVDRFVLATLESCGERPSPRAKKRALIRRATFDLIGLPPTPVEVETFLADDSPCAFETLIERLLASPRYGERWGRHWLDVVRYADTSGCNADNPVPAAYRYRNYVIQSFQDDKPFDRFVVEQIAGDLLPAASDEERFENTIATGYLAISRRFSSLGEEFHLTLDDTIDNLGKAFLGLTVSCARCHDHKFDPIRSHDYYALYGIFESTRFAFPGTEIYRHTRDHVPLVSAAEYESTIRPYLEKVQSLDAELYQLYTKKASLDTGEEKNRYDKLFQEALRRRDELVKQKPAFAQAYAVAEAAPVNSRVHKKGDPAQLGDEVARGFLQVLGGQRVPPEDQGSGRRLLAEWIVDPANPLAARVIVNRVWLHHFQEGLVRTPNDFGSRGRRPTHPELLDYLAARFVAGGWSIKALHRRIMFSATYQQESRNAAATDPENERLAHFNRRRLDAEEIRDALLAVSGALELSQGGEHPFLPEIEWRYTQHKPFLADFETNRRGVYLVQQRIKKQPFLEIFDGADPNAATGKRQPSTTALQALFMLNNPFVHEQAARMADRVLTFADSDRARMEHAYLLAYARPAEEDELSAGAVYLASCAARLPAEIAESDRRRAAWASYLRVLLSANEFIFVD